MPILRCLHLKNIKHNSNHFCEVYILSCYYIGKEVWIAKFDFSIDCTLFLNVHTKTQFATMVIAMKN